MRATFQNLARDFDVGLARVATFRFAGPARAIRSAARPVGAGLMPRSPPIRGPLPNVADHVVEAITVRRKHGHRRSALVAIGREILLREIALPSVGEMFAAGREFVAPGKLSGVEAAARGKLPLGFGRQLLAGPDRVSLGIAISDMHDRMMVQSADRAARTVGAPSVRGEFASP